MAYKDIELKRLKDELELVRAAMSRTIQNGQQRALTGSHSVSEVSYSKLLKRESSLKGQIIAIQGGVNVTVPDFS